MKTEKELFDALQAMIEGRHTLRVPPNEDKDEDLIISAAITELSALRRENEDLKARVDEVEGDLCEASELMERVWAGAVMGKPIRNKIKKTLSLPTLGASTRLRDKHYREGIRDAIGYINSEFINQQEWMETADSPEFEKAEHSASVLHGLLKNISAIARAREGK